MTGMPTAPDGYVACRVHDGRQNLLATGATRQVTHLVQLDQAGSNGGRPTVCGSRFDERNNEHRIVRCADIPGWSLTGGVSGPTIEQTKCPACWRGLDGKYPLNGTHLTDADDREMIATVADWPLRDRLPVKRRTSGDVDHGVMFADEFLVIRRTDKTPVVYSTVDEMVDAGWVVD